MQDTFLPGFWASSGSLPEIAFANMVAGKDKCLTEFRSLGHKYDHRWTDVTFPPRLHEEPPAWPGLNKFLQARASNIEKCCYRLTGLVQTSVYWQPV